MHQWLAMDSMTEVLDRLESENMAMALERGNICGSMTIDTLFETRKANSIAISAEIYYQTETWITLLDAFTMFYRDKLYFITSIKYLKNN